jgi:membrane protease YdiL (CAAX protease family)
VGVLGRAAAWLGRTARWLTVDQWRAIDAESPGARGFDWRALVVLVTACAVLTAQEYIGQRSWYYEHIQPYTRGLPAGPDMYRDLKAFAWWSGWRVGGYLVIPALVVLCMPGERLRDYYLSPRGFVRHLWIYVVLFAAVMPFVIWVSGHTSFQRQYPFYKWANRSPFDFWTWELLYIAQFLSLEFFFRGFLLQGLRRALGSNAIFVMIVPYCMIHYGKPVLETCGAIGAGLILGTIAMRTRSIWGGVLIHVGVAVSMDVLAVGHCPPPEAHRACLGD